MTKKHLFEQVGELLTLWKERLLPHWTITYDVVPQHKLEGMRNAWAVTNVMGGERRAHVVVAGDLPWGEGVFDLEQTIVHEVVHAISAECGTLLREDTLRPFVPTVVWDTLDRIQEVLVDRIANELIRAYGSATT